MKFNVIVADCPWSFNDKLVMDSVKRGACSNYTVMNMANIKGLPVKKLADPEGCLLALWVPSSMLKEGLDVMENWGFTHKQTYVWVKTKKDSLEPSFGMGRLFRNCHEICLIGINNSKIYKRLKNKSQRTVCQFANLKHSKKPELLQDSLEKMFPAESNGLLELFARRDREGWVCLGNECKTTLGLDIVESLDVVSRSELRIEEMVVSPVLVENGVALCVCDGEEVGIYNGEELGRRLYESVNVRCAVFKDGDDMLLCSLKEII